MMVSTKGRYALRIMLDLAQQEPETFISLTSVSGRQGVSVKYMEAIVAILNRAGFVESQRGKDGGYRLRRKPSEYTIGSILKLTEGSLAPVSCLDCDQNGCDRADHCLTLPMWQRLDEIIDGYLEVITLQDLLDGKTA